MGVKIAQFVLLYECEAITTDHQTIKSIMNVMEPELRGIMLSTEAGFLQLLIFYITRYIHEGDSHHK